MMCLLRRCVAGGGGWAFSANPKPHPRSSAGQILHHHTVQLSGPGPSRKERLAAITDAHTYCTHTHKHTDHRTPKTPSSEASSICDSSKSLADIDLVPRLAAHSGRVELSGAAGRSWDHSRRQRQRPWAQTHGSVSSVGANNVSKHTIAIAMQTKTNKHTHTHTCIRSLRALPLPQRATLNVEWEGGQKSVRERKAVHVCDEERLVVV